MKSWNQKRFSQKLDEARTFQRIQPTTNRSLKRLVEKLAKSPVRIIPVYYFVRYQGCRVKVEGQTLPNKRDVYACSYVEITNPQKGTG